MGARSGCSKHSNLLREPEAHPEEKVGETLHLRLALWSAPAESTVWLQTCNVAQSAKGHRTWTELALESSTI